MIGDGIEAIHGWFFHTQAQESREDSPGSSSFVEKFFEHLRAVIDFFFKVLIASEKRWTTSCLSEGWISLFKV